MAGGTAAGTLSVRDLVSPPVMRHSRLRVATAGDDAAIRALLRRSVPAGNIRLAFTREPAYAAGESLAGSTDVTVIADGHEGVCAMGRCSVQPLMRNGAPARVGYLGELRTDAGTPGMPRLLREGYALLAEHATAAGAEGFVTAIADDNARARRVLERGGRLGLPRYVPLAGLVTLIMPAARTTAAMRDGDATEADPTASLEELTAFLSASASRHQLALAWHAHTWAELAPHGVRPLDACVVRRGTRIVAAAVLWDQRAFRQTVVTGYGTALGLVRPVLNAMAAVVGQPTLPTPRSVLAQGTLLAATAESPSAWRALLSLVRARAASRGLSMVVATFDRRDEAVSAIRTCVRARAYRTIMYEVQFAGHRGFRTPWDERLLRPEAGLL